MDTATALFGAPGAARPRLHEEGRLDAGGDGAASGRPAIETVARCYRFALPGGGVQLKVTRRHLCPTVSTSLVAQKVFF